MLLVAVEQPALKVQQVHRGLQEWSVQQALRGRLVPTVLQARRVRTALQECPVLQVLKELSVQLAQTARQARRAKPGQRVLREI